MINAQRRLVILILFLGVSFGGAALIDWEIGVRPQGMGGAFVAVVDDGNAPYWNPAGLAQVKTLHQVMVMQSLSKLRGNLRYLSYTYNTKWGGIGLSWSNLEGILREGRPGHAKKSKLSEDVYSLGYGKCLFGKIALGVNLKRYYLTSAVGGGGGIGLDLGILCFPIKTLTLGLVKRDITASVKDEVTHSSYRIGMLGKLFREKVFFTLDLNTKCDVNEKEGLVFLFHSGLEYWIIPSLAIRMGYAMGYKKKGIFTTGFTYIHKDRYCLEYAYIGNEIRGTPHVFSFSWRFKKQPEVKVKKEGTISSKPPRKIKKAVPK
jgi:hypothetical protein